LTFLSFVNEVPVLLEIFKKENRKNNLIKKYDKIVNYITFIGLCSGSFPVPKINGKT